MTIPVTRSPVHARRDELPGRCGLNARTLLVNWLIDAIAKARFFAAVGLFSTVEEQRVGRRLLSIECCRDRSITVGAAAR